MWISVWEVTLCKLGLFKDGYKRTYNNFIAFNFGKPVTNHAARWTSELKSEQLKDILSFVKSTRCWSIETAVCLI